MSTIKTSSLQVGYRIRVVLGDYCYSNPPIKLFTKATNLRDSVPATVTIWSRNPGKGYYPGRPYFLQVETDDGQVARGNFAGFLTHMEAK
jgi:hypothetical protein